MFLSRKEGAVIDILVTYDVNTETKEGRRRLRRVALACQSYGQRVQLSVFECRVDEAQLETLRARLFRIMDPDVDSLRIYRLRAPREESVDAFGVDRYVDFDKPLVL